jgi:hypothetical protein
MMEPATNSILADGKSRKERRQNLRLNAKKINHLQDWIKRRICEITHMAYIASNINMNIIMNVFDCKARGGRSTETIERSFFRQSAVLQNVTKYYRAVKIGG